MKTKLFFIDAETDGLYGDFISVAGMITDTAGIELERFYYGVKKENLHVQEPWVIENVLPRMGTYTEVEDEAELLETVWSKWQQYKEDAYAVGDVIYPVEARLFQKCVSMDMEHRRFEAPFPFLDLSSLLYANGIDPLTDRNILSGLCANEKQHNCMYDVEMAVEIYKKLMR